MSKIKVACFFLGHGVISSIFRSQRGACFYLSGLLDLHHHILPKPINTIFTFISMSTSFLLSPSSIVTAFLPPIQCKATLNTSRGKQGKPMPKLKPPTPIQYEHAPLRVRCAMLRKHPPVDPVLSCLSCFRKPSVGVSQVVSNSPDPGLRLQMCNNPAPIILKCSFLRPGLLQKNCRKV